MKKLVRITLIVGALLVVGLLGVGLKLSHDIKQTLQDSLNHLAPHIHAAPFECSGFKHIECVSAGVQESKLGPLVVQLAQVKSDGLEFTLDIKHIHNPKKWTPKSAHCTIHLQLKDQVLNTQSQCQAPGELNYNLGLIARLKDPTKPLNLKALLQTNNLKALQVHVNTLNVDLKSKDFKAILLPLLQESGDLKDPKDYDKALEQIQKSFQGVVIVGLMVAGLQEEVAHAQELIKSFNAFARGQKDHFGFSVHNQDSAFKPLDAFNNPWEFLPHLSLKVHP
ncbi:hypothetical protein [Helicobacter cynogastricus]|uniref:hypothetical protein n=1 Tax=Helicobacter cynogastricus TaxID=329937 RepID=UPI001F447C3A|nr:hypothetical protein [Helicobacter cynogastricus]